MQTATESTDLRSVREQLEHLKAGISAVAAKEDEFIKLRAARLLAVRKEIARREESEADSATQRLHEIAAVRQREIDDAHERAQFRGARIHEAFHASRSRLALAGGTCRSIRYGLRGSPATLTIRLTSGESMTSPDWNTT